MPRPEAGPELREEASRVLLARFAPDALLIDDAFEPLLVHGEGRRFLRAELRPRLETLVERARRGEPSRGVVAHHDCEAIGIRTGGDRRRRWLLLFTARGDAGAARPRPDAELSAVHDELRRRYEDLHGTNRALKAARDFAESLVDTVNDPLLVLDRHLKVLRASRSYCRLFRSSQEELAGRSIYEIERGLWNAPGLREQLSALAAREKPFEGYEAEFEVPRLGRRVLAIGGRVVPHREDDEPRVVVSIEDATPRRQAAEAAALRKSESRQREFVASVSHELMTPIAAIKGCTESLVAGALDLKGQRERFTQMIVQNAERLEQLVEDLLQLSAYDAGRAPRGVETVALRAAVERITRGLAPGARKRGLDVRIRIPAGLKVEAHRGELARVLLSLLENAVKYNRRDGWIRVRAERVGKRAVVSVEDGGIGIPSEDLARVFDRFHRAPNARAKTARSNGLGLSIARAILEARGCRIWAESVEGKGTMVSFTLPLAPARRPRHESGTRS